MLVKLGDPVTKGQKLAIQRNAFGDVLREYSATTDGRVATIATDAVREPGQRLLQILTLAGPAECPGAGCPMEPADYDE